MRKNKKIEIRIMPVILCIVAIIIMTNIILAETTIYEKNSIIKPLQIVNEGDVASIGDVGYKTLEEAVAAAENGNEITLLASSNISNAIEIDKELKINLNEQIITVEKGISVTSNGKLTVTNGKISLIEGTEESVVIDNNGALILGKIQINSVGYGIKNNGTLRINDDQVVIIARTPIEGKVNEIFNNSYFVETNEYTENEDLNQAKVVTALNAEKYVVCQNISYKNVHEAWAAIDETTTEEVEIKLIKDLTDESKKYALEVKETQKIKLNLNGHKLMLYTEGIYVENTEITYTIVNNGTLDIINGSLKELEAGQWEDIIFNNGTLNIDTVVLFSNSPYINKDLYNNGGIVNVIGISEFNIYNEQPEGQITIGNQGNDTTLTGNITNSSELNIQSATITGNMTNSGTLSIKDGTVTGNITNNATLDILSGTVTGDLKNNSGTTTIGEENGTDEEMVNIIGTITNKADLIINNGQILPTEGYGIDNYDGGNITINKGNIINSGWAIFDDNTEEHVIQIKEGLIKNTTGSAIGANSTTKLTLILGEDDKKVNKETPEIIGEGGYGVSQWATVEFYDGIVKGTTSSGVKESKTTFGEENAEYYETNFEIVYDEQETEDSLYVTRLKDILAPTVNAKILKSETTSESITIQLDAQDTGYGLEKYIIYYKDKLESTTYNTGEIQCDGDLSAKKEVITGLNIGSNYIFKVRVYDKEGLYTDAEIEGSTSSGINSVSLNKTSLTMQINDTETLVATIDPSDATNKNVTWSSSNENVATVNENGLVTAIGDGEAQITVTTQDGGKTSTCNVTVKDTIPTLDLPSNSGEVWNNVQEINLLDTIIGVDYQYSIDGGTTWLDCEKDSNENWIVKLTEDGRYDIKVRKKDSSTSISDTYKYNLDTVEPGILEKEINTTTTTLSAKFFGFDDLSGISRYEAKLYRTNTSGKELIETYCGTQPEYTFVGLDSGTVYLIELAVYDNAENVTTTSSEYSTAVAVSGVTLDKNSLELIIGEKETETLTPQINPTNAANKNVTWSSSDNNVATVNNGIITAKGNGTATITVKTQDGNYTDTCTVTVITPIQTVTLDKTEVTIENGKTVTLTETINPQNASIVEKTWKSNNDTIATVNNGVITAKSIGEAIIELQVKDAKGNVKKAECKVSVTEPTVDNNYISLTNVQLDKTSVNLYLNETATMKAIYTPTNADIETVIWTSSDESIVTVGNGVVKAIKVGNATITVTVKDKNGNVKMATSTVTVKEPVEENKYTSITELQIDATTLSLKTNETKTLKLTYAPTNADINTISWISSNEGVATVNDGVVKALKAGEATITAIVTDKNENIKTIKCKVTVTAPVIEEENDQENNEENTDKDNMDKENTGSTDNTNKEDTTTSKDKLPDTGIKGIIIALVIITIASIVIFIRYKSFRDVK